MRAVKMAKISIAKQFSRFPAGRYKTDGPHSGEKFREEHLVPALQKDETVTIELDGARGYGSSFLEEAFGGLIRTGADVTLVKKKLRLHSKDQSLVSEINEYIEKAIDKNKHARMHS